MCDVRGLVPVADEIFAEAYDAVDATLRARLKTNIALHHSMLGVTPSLNVTHTNRATAGFAMTEQKQAVSWTVIVLGESFASGPRLVAALMPALLAGVEDVHVVRVTDGEQNASPWPQALLAALELAGQEQASTAAVDALVNFIGEKGGSGRLLFLGDDGAKSRIVHAVAKMPNIEIWSSTDKPRIYIDSEADFDADLMRWAHPDAVFCETVAEGGEVDAVFTVGDGQEYSHNPKAPLTLRQGCDALWIYPSLKPDFFLQQSVIITLIE